MITLIAPFPYPGSKSKLLSKFLSRCPDRYDVYYEPFLGAGSCFLALQPHKARLSDSSENVINFWCILQNRFPELLKALRKYKFQKRHIFKKLLKEDVQNPIEKAARFLYLQKTSFGSFGIAYNDRQTNKPLELNYNIPNLCNINQYLKNNDIEFKCAPFSQINNITKKDFVFMDPPYKTILKYKAMHTGECSFNENEFLLYVKNLAKINASIILFYSKCLLKPCSKIRKKNTQNILKTYPEYIMYYN